MFSRDSENGVTLELDFYKRHVFVNFLPVKYILKSDSSQFSTANNLRYTVIQFAGALI